MAIGLGEIVGQIGTGIYKLVKGKDVSITDADANNLTNISDSDTKVILVGNNQSANADNETKKSTLQQLFNYIKNKLTSAGLTFPGFGTTSTTALRGDTSLLQLGNTSTTALAGDTTTITQAQIDKVGHLTVTASTDLDTMRSDVSDNNAKIGITAQQASDITTNNAKTGITTTQANAITNNTNEISNLKNDKADLSSPTFTGTVAIPNISNVETAITTNQTNIASNTTAISNKPSTAVTDIDFVPSSASLIHLDTTTSPSGTEKRLSINAGTNLSLDSTSATSFTINAPAFGTSAGTILEGNTTLVNSLVAGTGISISSSSGDVTVTSTATATPAGGNGQIQYNNNGAFGATTLGFSPASGSDPAVLSFSGTLKIHNVQAEDDDRPIISTDNNETTISGRVNIATREIKIQSTQQNAGTGRGDVVYYGSVADSGNLTAGKVYYYAPNGNWTLVNASAVGTSSGILGVALGASPTTNGLLVNGSVFLNHHAGTGDGQTLYLSTTDGQLTSTKPTGDNQVRIVGTVIKHHTDRCEVLFDPTNFDGQATNPTASFTDNKSLLLDGLSDYAWNTSLSGIDNWGKSKGTLSVWVNLNITDDNGKNLISFYDGDNTNFGNFLIISYYKVSSSRYALLVRQRRTESGTQYNFGTVAQQSSSFHGRPFQRTSSSFNSIQENYNGIRTSDTWTHIVYTWDNTETYQYNNTTYYGNQKIYVNGELKGFGTGTIPGHNAIGTAITTGSFPPDRSTSFTHLVVGSLNPLAHGLTNMKVNDLAIWDVDLNQNNVTAIYNSSTNNYANGSTTDLLTDSGNYNESGNLAGYWKFEDNLNDSKNSNHLTGVGTTFDTSTP